MSWSPFGPANGQERSRVANSAEPITPIKLGFREMMPAMNIDSGGTGGPQADDALFALVDRSNVHGDLPGDADPLRIARRFVAAGWSARASAFDEYEVAHTWAELVLWTSAPNHHMFSGIVYPDRIANLAAVFDELGLAYSFEVDLPEDVPGPRMYQSATGDR